MDIKEVLNLPIGTEVQSNSVWYRVASENGVKVLTRGGYSVKLTQPLVTTEYELVRKKLNFLEALRLVDEGKVVESGTDKYIKRSGKLRYFGVEDDNAPFIGENEIDGDWYEVTE